jgi:hypothetical protein
MCSEDVQASVASIQLNVLFVAPVNVIPPPSTATSDVEPYPRTIFLSSTCNVCVSIVVVVPFTVKFPVTTRLSFIVVVLVTDQLK